MSLRAKFITLLLILNGILILFSYSLFINFSTNKKIKNEIAIIDNVKTALYEELIAVNSFYTSPLTEQIKTLNTVEKNLDLAISDLLSVDFLTNRSYVIRDAIETIITTRYDSLYNMPEMWDLADKILNDTAKANTSLATLEVIKNTAKAGGIEQLQTRIERLEVVINSLEQNISSSLASFAQQYQVINAERSDIERTGILTFIIMFSSIALLSVAAGVLIIKSIIDVTLNLERAHKETDAIFRNIHEGVFQLDQDLKIGNLCSKYFDDLFHFIDFRGMLFSEFLKQIGIPGKDLFITEDFLKLFFNKDININLLGQVNPIDRITISVIDDNGNASEKHLSFSFSMFKNVSDSMYILGTVKDITEEVLYAEALKEEEEKNREKMEQIFQVIHVEPSVMAEFFEDSQIEIDRINDLLKSNKTEYHEILREIFLSVHSIKGNAQLLGMKNFAAMIHKLEDKIKLLLDEKVIEWESILEFAIHLGDIQEGIKELKERINDILKFQSNFKGLSDKAGLFERALQRVLFSEGAQAGKTINLECSNFNSKEIPDKHRKLIKDIFVQLARNAVNHGIETPETRKLKKKKEEGTIFISMKKDPETGSIEYSFKDDGGGINIDLISRKAKEVGLIKEGQSFTVPDAVKFIFHSGFSTAKNTTLGAGRGIGLSIVKSRVIAANGKIRIKTQKDKYCEYIITLPESHEEQKDPEKSYA